MHPTPARRPPRRFSTAGGLLSSSSSSRHKSVTTVLAVSLLLLLLAAASIDLGLLVRPTHAHPSHHGPGGDHDDEHAALARRDAASACHALLSTTDERGSFYAETNARLARRAASLGADPFVVSRLARRSFLPLADGTDPDSDPNSAAAAEAAVAAPATCVADTEVTGGPYYIHNFIHRSNMTETQPGVPLILDVSVVDIATCAPLPAAAVELWSCNATGYYSGFTGVSPDTSTYTLPCLTPNPAGDDSGDACMTDELTFLRGFVLTDSSGVAEMATVFPGFYTGRTPHIHVTVHTGGSVGRDGTYVGGGLRHVGQLYPGDDAATAVYALVGSPYYARAKAAAFVRLADDAFAAGDSLHRGVLNLTRLGGAAASVGGGLIGAVTVFVDTKANMSDPSANRYDSRASWIGTEVATGRLTATSSSASSSATNRNSTSGSAVSTASSGWFTLLIASCGLAASAALPIYT